MRRSAAPFATPLAALLAVVCVPGLLSAQSWQPPQPPAAAATNAPEHAEPESGPVFKAQFENTEIAPSEWTLTLYPDGRGYFHADRANSTAPRPTTIEPITVDRAIQLSPEFTAEVFRTVRQNDFFNLDCASHMKVAFQGWKTLSYHGPDGAGSCRFNYSKNKQIEALAESLVAVSSTLMEGARLELLRAHEPLGLDREMAFIVDAASDGRLRQMCAIRGILKELETDPSVMERVRKQARKLLAQAAREH